MSIKQFPGGIITQNPTAPTTSSAKGIWTLDQAQNYTKQGIWPRSPGAPTIGTATATGTSTATVAFTAPSCLGNGSISYTATSNPGGYTGGGTTSPLTVSGLAGNTSYTFSVAGATPGGTGPSSAASNSITTFNAGSQSYTTPGLYCWVAPAGVTSVSIVAIGGGGGGRVCGCTYWAGGGLGWTNNVTVVPGNSYQLRVGVGGVNSRGTDSYGPSNAATGGGGGTAAGTHAGTGGGNGGAKGNNAGGGAGGYSGNGGQGGCSGVGNAGAGGGGGGGGGGSLQNGYTCRRVYFGAGGGTGLCGQGSNGAGGTTGTTGGGGGGGSSGCNGGNATNVFAPPTGGAYGGAGGTTIYQAGPYVCCSWASTTYYYGAGKNGAVRIVWPGNTRQFPSTCVGSP